MKKLLLVLVALSLVILGFYIARKEKQSHLMAASIVQVKVGSVKNIIDATGIVKPQVGAEVKVGARISGTVMKENVRIGDHVKKGDLIAVIDNRALKDDLRKAKTELEKVKLTYPSMISQQELSLKSAVASYKACLSKLKAARENYNLKLWEFNRQVSLFKSGYTTREKLKMSRVELKSAKASLSAARQDLKRAELDINIQRKKLSKLKDDYECDLQTARANFEKAKTNYSYSYIYAPQTGVVSYVSTQKGETVVAGLNAPEFVTILDPNRLEDWIYVDETEIGKVKKGMKAVFTVDAYRNRTFTGRVEEIYPEPQIMNNVVYYIVVVRDIKNVAMLKPGMTTHNTLISGVRKNVLVVPNDAVKWENGRYVVYKVVGKRSKKFKVVPVKVGWSDENLTEIKSGLRKGDKIAERLKAGG